MILEGYSSILNQKKRLDGNWLSIEDTFLELASDLWYIMTKWPEMAGTGNTVYTGGNETLSLDCELY